MIVPSPARDRSEAIARLLPVLLQPMFSALSRLDAGQAGGELVAFDQQRELGRAAAVAGVAAAFLLPRRRLVLVGPSLGFHSWDSSGVGQVTASMGVRRGVRQLLV